MGAFGTGRLCGGGCGMGGIATTCSRSIVCEGFRDRGVECVSSFPLDGGCAALEVRLPFLLDGCFGATIAGGGVGGLAGVEGGMPESESRFIIDMGLSTRAGGPSGGGGGGRAIESTLCGLVGS
jgi:hypothetical protein